MSTDCSVVIEKFAERHFIKLFEKKYKRKWEVTERAILDMLRRIEALVGTNSYIETICASGSVTMLKVEFRVAGTEQSRHGSGNRCIVAWHTDTATVRILLVYGKTDVRGARETDWWKDMVRENYLHYRAML